MDWKIELVAIPVTDVGRAKEFYVDRVGFHADHDYQVTDALRFVQLTPPGSACSIVMGTGIRRGRCRGRPDRTDIDCHHADAHAHRSNALSAAAASPVGR